MIRRRGSDGQILITVRLFGSFVPLVTVLFVAKGADIMPKKTSKRRGEHPQAKGRTLGGPVHSRPRSRNREVHHQKRPRQDASGSKKEKLKKSHRGKRGNRLRQSENLHRGNMAGSLDGELRQSKTQTVHLQNLARLSEKPHQAADRRHPAGRSHFSGLAEVLQASAGRWPGRPH